MKPFAFAIFLAATLPPACLAQEEAAIVLAAGPQEFSQEMREHMGAMFASRMGPAKVVKGAPYAAEVITEASQTLADGNVISRRTTGAAYRDGEGRTRQETGTAEGKARTVFISDPVAHTYFVLSPNAKRAMSVPQRADTREKKVVRLGGSEIRVEDGKVYVDGKEASSGHVEIVKGGKTIVVDDGKVTIDGREVGMEDGHRRVIVKRIEGEDGTQREEVRVQVLRSGDDKDVVVAPGTPLLPPGAEHLPLIAPLPGVQTLRFESTARLGKGVTASLGTRDFDGVKAEGKSTTWTIPAGQIGNRNPITVTSETWFAPELQVTVYSRHADPRTGESIYRLASIRRGEPSADLFKVPEDYTLKSRGPKG